MGSVKQEEILERIALALEGIDQNLSYIEDSMKNISDAFEDSKINNPRGSAIAVAVIGPVNTIN